MIVFFDVATALASKWLHFDYTRLIWASFCLYAVCGYLGFAYRHLLGGALAGLMAGLTDSTIGWALSTAIRPYTRVAPPRPTIAFDLNNDRHRVFGRSVLRSSCRPDTLAHQSISREVIAQDFGRAEEKLFSLSGGLASTAIDYEIPFGTTR